MEGEERGAMRLVPSAERCTQNGSSSRLSGLWMVFEIISFLVAPSNGSLPRRMRYMMTPTLQRSASFPYPLKFRTSGAT